ncbi:hypothetical protein HG430_001275 [Candidatus Gracilibacteria bacterium]|nr:hypothetical protein [Candidatus Gracilibacteria bacterium]
MSNSKKIIEDLKNFINEIINPPYFINSIFYPFSKEYKIENVYLRGKKDFIIKLVICYINNDTLNISSIEDSEIEFDLWGDIKKTTRNYKGLGTKIIYLCTKFALDREIILKFKPTTKGWAYWNRFPSIKEKKDKNLNKEIEIILFGESLLQFSYELENYINKQKTNYLSS